MVTSLCAGMWTGHQTDKDPRRTPSTPAWAHMRQRLQPALLSAVLQARLAVKNFKCDLLDGERRRTGPQPHRAALPHAHETAIAVSRCSERRLWRRGRWRAQPIPLLRQTRVCDPAAGAHRINARLGTQLCDTLVKQRPHPPAVWSSQGASGRGQALVGVRRAGRRHCKVWVVQRVGVRPCQIRQVLPRRVAEVALPQKYASSGFSAPSCCIVFSCLVALVLSACSRRADWS